MTIDYLTTRQIADHYAVAIWQVRRVVDAMLPRVPRIGIYRAVPAGLLPSVQAELQRRGYLRQGACNVG